MGFDPSALSGVKKYKKIKRMGGVGWGGGVVVSVVMLIYSVD